MTHYQLTDAERARAERIDQLVVLGGVDELIASLADSSWTVRRAAIAALASLGDEAVAPMCAWLAQQRTSENAIAAVVDALVASQGGVVAEVTALTDHPRWEVAADAANILGRRRESGAVPALCRVVLHPNDNVAIAALEALGLIGGSESLDALITATETTNFFRVFAAMQVLARIDDPRVVAPLVRLLGDPAYRDEAARALGRTGSVHAIAPLLELLDDATPAGDTLRLVVSALGELISRAEWNGSIDHVETMLRSQIGAAVSKFTNLLATSPPEDTRRIAHVVGRLGGPAELGALASFIDSAKDDTIIESIKRIARRHEEALPQVLADADSKLRGVLLPTVTSRRCAAVLRDLLADDDDEIRTLACHALARIGDVAAVPLLFAALENPRVGLAATFAIHALGVADTEARTIRVLREGSKVARRHALRIVSHMGFTKAFEAVTDAVHDDDRRISELAIATLGALDDPRVDHLLEQLARTDQPAPQRIVAIRALSHRQGKRALAVLSTAIDDELSWVRYYACQGLGRLRPAGAIDALIARVRDRSAHVHLAAIEALSQFDSPAARRAVIEAATSDDPDELRAGLLGIGLDPQDEALPVLFRAAASNDVATQIIALSGLARFRTPAPLARIVECAFDPRTEVRETAVSLLAERADREAADALVDVVTRVEDELHPAHLALSRPSPARVAAIFARSETADERVAVTLTAALARMQTPAGVAALFGLLVTPNPIARRVAASVLIRIGEPTAVEVVARMARTDPDPIVRSVCAAATQAPGE